MKILSLRIFVVFGLVIALLGNLNIKNVSAGCSIITFSVSPDSPQNAGTTINLYAKAQCGANVRAIRFKVDGNIIYELGAPEASATWNTSGASSGTHSLTVEAAEWGDNNWSNPASSTISFQINSTPPPPANPKCQITSFSTSPSSPQTPGTSVSISAGGSCDTGVRAMRVKIDGNVIYELGAPNITANWNSPSSEGSHTIAVEVAGWGDNSWSYAASQSSTFVLKNNTPTQPPANPKCQITSFSTSPSSPQTPGTSVAISAGGSCDTGVRAMRVKIDGNVIYELGAPNITANWNSPLSEGSHTIAVEVAGWGDNSWSYAASQSKTFTIQNNNPTGPENTQTQSPIIIATDDVQQTMEPFGGQEENNPSKPEWCSIPIIGSLCKSFYLQASDLTCDPQCMKTARNLRPDMNYWASDRHTPADVVEAASLKTPFKLSDGWTYTVHVRAETENDPITAKDLIFWPKDCQKVPYEGGHIGYVESISGNSIWITDSNWGKASPEGVCASRSNVKIELESCMVFISNPEITYEFDLSLPTTDTPSATLKQSILDWFKNLFGGK